mgnify:CR=1 FL=1
MTAKALATAIAAHILEPATTLSWALEIISPVGPALRFCDASKSTTIEGEIYSALPSMAVANIVLSLGLEVNNTRVSVGDLGIVKREDVIDGVWDGSRFRLFQFNWARPADGLIPWVRGFIGEIKPGLAIFEMETRDLRQALHQDVTRTHQFACPNELGDARCRKDLTGFTSTDIEVTAVTSNRLFTTTLSEVAGWATEGRILFTTGASANGIWRKVTLHAAAGVLTLDRPAILGVAVGDRFTVVAGCQHRPVEDCQTKFDNMVNYGGCPTKPTVSDLSTGKLAV